MGPRYAEWLRAARRDDMRRLLALASERQAISFAVGLPATEELPGEVYAESVAEAVRESPGALQLGPPEAALEAQIVELMRERGVTCHAGQILLTSGAQQGIDLMCRLLLDPGQCVAAEAITYAGLLMALEPHQPRLLTVSTDLARGLDVEQLAVVLSGSERPRFLYTMTEGHNPLGISMPLPVRRRIVDLAREHGVPVIEDDAYGFLGYEDEMAPAMRALDADTVIYLGSFSKMLAPGLRTGWIVAPEEMVAKLAGIKDLSDINSANINQRALAALLRRGRLGAHMERVRRVYRERRDQMDAAMRAHFPAGVSWTLPRSGIYFWVQLPGALDAGSLLERAVDEAGVVFVPGSAFAARGDAGRSSFRLCFTSCRREDIEPGIARLGRLLARQMDGASDQEMPARVADARI